MRDIADASVPAYTVTAGILHLPVAPRKSQDQRRGILLVGADRHSPRRGGETPILRLSSR
jgi:hypothetical protein